MSARQVSVQVPGVASYMSLLRTVAGACVGREDFTLDQIEDVKMAVDEAGAQLLGRLDNRADAQISLRIDVSEDGVGLVLSAPAAAGGDVIKRDSFSWTILQALSDELRVDHDGTDATVSMRKLRVGQESV